MEAQHSDIIRAVARTLLKGAIAVLALIVLRLIVSNLPMITDAAPMTITALFGYSSADVPLAGIAQTVIDTFIFITILVTARNVRQQIARSNLHFPALGNLIFLITALGVLVLAYSSYVPVISTLVGGPGTYIWIFLIVGIVIVGALATVVYRNLDAITDAAFHSGARLAGMKESGAEKQEAVTDTACAGCQASLASDARFCPGCGRPVDASKAVA